MHNEDTGPQFSHFGMFVTDLEKVAGFYSRHAGLH